MKRELLRTAFYDNVVRALDKTAGTFFGDAAMGADDSDLPRLFRAIDVQIETLAKRYNATLED